MIGNIIQDKRKALGLTQAELADLLGVSSPAVNKWEKNMCYPDMESIAPLARILQTDLNTLFSFYEVLSEKERDLIIDDLNYAAENNPKEVKPKICEIVKQNPMDSNLYRDIADTLYKLKMQNKLAICEMALNDIAEYYEKANELLPEKNNDISYALVNVYADMCNKEKAEAAWDDIKEMGLNKNWIRVEMKMELEDYDDALVEAKEVILRDIIGLGTKLDFLSTLFKNVNNREMSKLAYEKAHELRNMFGLWKGLNILSDIFRAKEFKDIIGLKKAVKELKNITNKNVVTESPLFMGVQLGGKSKYTSESADLVADLVSTIQGLQ